MSNDDKKKESEDTPGTGIVDLSTFARKATDREVYMTLVALFNEDPKNPRVLADSEDYLAYTLKNGRTVRLVARSNNMKGSLRAHAKPIHALSFVNYRSNVAASSSESEFFVWVVKNENAAGASPDISTLTVRLYFKLKDDITICRFSFFINISVGTPDLLVLYSNKVAVLESSRLMQEFSSEPLEASLAKDSRELRELSEPVTLQTLCCINNAGWFAFTTETTLVVACTLRNRGTPAWPACDDAPVKGLELLDTPSPDSPAMLFACSDVKIFQWKVTGQSEPSQLRVLTFGSGLVAMLSSKATLAVFNQQHQAALIEMRPQDELQAVIYPINASMRAGSICFSRLQRYGCVLVDAQSQIEMYQFMVETLKIPAGIATLESSPSSKSNLVEDANPTTTAVTATVVADPLPVTALTDPAILSVTSKGSVASPTTRVADATRKSASPGSVILSNLMQQVQRGNLRFVQKPPETRNGGTPAQPSTPPTQPPPPQPPLKPQSPPQTPQQQPSTTTTVPSAAAVTPVTAAAVAAPPPTAGTAARARALLQNTALPKPINGPLAVALFESEESLRRELDSLLNSCKNINEILRLSPDQLARDHEQLLNLALEAQMTALQSAGATIQAGSPGREKSGSEAATTALHPGDSNFKAFNSYAITELMLPIAQDIVKGVTLGINNTLRSELDHGLRATLCGGVREAQATALKKRMDSVLNECATIFANDVRQRFQLFSERELVDVFDKIGSTMKGMVEENRSLQAALKEVLATNAPAELQALREELRELKASLRAGAFGPAGASLGDAFGEAQPFPEAVVTTVRGLIEQGKTADALEFLLMAKQPLLILRFFSQLEEESYSDIIADPQVTVCLWTRLLKQISKPEDVESVEDTQYAMEVMLDILSEHADILRDRTAKTQQMMNDLQHFLTNARTKITSHTGLSILRDLEKSIQ